MVEVKFASEVREDLRNIKKTNKKLFTRIDKQLILFTQNPKHPSLRIHKLKGQFKDTWSISITMSVRMVYRKVGDDSFVFVKIGTHNEVYRKK